MNFFRFLGIFKKLVEIIKAIPSDENCFNDL